MVFQKINKWWENNFDITILLVIVIGIIDLILKDPTNSILYGTLLASFVAIYVAFLPKVWEFKNRPIIKTEFENEAPYCRYAVLYSKESDSYWIRIKIRNIGNSTAKKCEVKLDKITYINPKITEKFNPEKNVDIVSLRWVDSSIEQVATISGVSYSRYVKYEDIGASSYQYVNLVFFRKDNPDGTYIGATDIKPRGMWFDIPKAESLFHIIIYAENTKTVHETYKLKIEGSEYDKVKFEKI